MSGGDDAVADLQIGFIGCGGIAHQKHLPGMVQQQGVVLAAFCDIDRERAQQAASKYGGPGARVYTDYRELLADPALDAVHVLTPNVSHAEITVAALDAGKHVLCEKPMAINAKEAKAMLDARDRSGKLLTIGYQYRHFHDHAVAKKVVEDGWLGDIYYAEATYIRRRGVPTWGVFTDKAKQGGGALIDIGTHALDLTLWLMDNHEVDYVVGSAYEKLGRLLEPEYQGQVDWRGNPDSWDHRSFEVDDFAVGFIKMKNGASIHLKASWALNMATKPGMVLLCGTKGGLDTYDGVRLNHVVAGQQAITRVGEKIAAYIPGYGDDGPQRSAEHEIWVAALKGEGELFVLPEQAFVVTRILEAIYESSRTGRAVHF
jgi:predicted dehydrogenase